MTPEVPLGKALGFTTTVNINGKDWTLTRSTWDMQAEWGRWLANRAMIAAENVANNYRAQTVGLREQLRQLQESAKDFPGRGMEVERAEINAKGKKLVEEINALEQRARDTMERYQDRVAAGDFEFYSATVGGLAQQNLPGQFYLLWLCLRPNHPGITIEEVIKANIPVYGGQNFIEDWNKALLASEGTTPKNDLSESPAPGSTPTTKTSENP